MTFRQTRKLESSDDFPPHAIVVNTPIQVHEKRPVWNTITTMHIMFISVPNLQRDIFGWCFGDTRHFHPMVRGIYTRHSKQATHNTFVSLRGNDFDFDTIHKYLCTKDYGLQFSAGVLLIAQISNHLTTHCHTVSALTSPALSYYFQRVALIRAAFFV